MDEILELLTCYYNEMNEKQSYQEIIDSHKKYYEPEKIHNKTLVITVDTSNSNLLSPKNKSYRSISSFIDGYFTDRDIETLVAPPVFGRGATGMGEFNLAYFIMTHATLILSVLRTVPLIVKFVRATKKFREDRRAVKHQKLYNSHSSSVGVSLRVLSNEENTQSNTFNNYHSISSLLTMLPELYSYLKVEYGYLNFSFYISAGTERHSYAYSINLTDIVPNIDTIGEIFKKIDSHLITDDESVVFTAHQNKSKIKFDKSNSVHLSPWPI